MALAKQAEVDFSAGFYRELARHLIPDNGAYDVMNGLLTNSGSVYRRGGSEYLSNAALGTGLRMLWDGLLSPGGRTLFASATKFGTLAGDGVSPVDLGGSGLAAPARAAGLKGLLFVGGGTLYGGSQKTADYSTGTVSVTSGSASVTGAGGAAFTANVDAGMLLRVAGSGRYYVVQSVDSNTTLTLTDNYEGSTAGGQAYALTRLGSAGVVPYRQASFYDVAAKRVIAVQGDKVFESGFGNPHSWGANDFHQLPTGAQGLGVAAVGGVALVFTTQGVFAISNLEAEFVDSFGAPLQRMGLVSGDLVLWGDSGIASWEGRAVVPATDGLWEVTPAGPTQILTRSIETLWRDYVHAGYSPGGAAVYRNHYFLPILDASASVVDVLVCRVDRPQWASGSRGQRRIPWYWPWTRLSGAGANVSAFARRVGGSAAARQPELLGAGRATSSRVLKLSAYFEPTAARKNDHDGSTFPWWIETRDYPTGGAQNENYVAFIRPRYELVDASGTDNPKVQAYYSVGKPPATGSFYGSAFYGTGAYTDSTVAGLILLPWTGYPSDGTRPTRCYVKKRGRYIRFRLQSSDPAASLVLRSLEIWTRVSHRP